MWVSTSCTAGDPSLASSSPVWQHGLVIMSQGNMILWKPHMAKFSRSIHGEESQGITSFGWHMSREELGAVLQELGWQGFMVPGTWRGSPVSCPLAEWIGEGWCHVGTVGMWWLVAFVAFLQSADTTESILRKHYLAVCPLLLPHLETISFGPSVSWHQRCFHFSQRLLF